MNNQRNFGIEMIPEEVDQQTTIAQQIYNRIIKAGDKITPAQMFLLGFLHGRQFTLEDMGIFKGEQDDNKIYQFLKNESQ